MVKIITADFSDLSDLYLDGYIFYHSKQTDTKHE